jgi:flagellin-like hook-associated protein FlgL
LEQMASQAQSRIDAANAECEAARKAADDYVSQVKGEAEANARAHVDTMIADAEKTRRDADSYATKTRSNAKADADRVMAPVDDATSKLETIVAELGTKTKELADVTTKLTAAKAEHTDILKAGEPLRSRFGAMA